MTWSNREAETILNWRERGELTALSEFSDRFSTRPEPGGTLRLIDFRLEREDIVKDLGEAYLVTSLRKEEEARLLDEALPNWGGWGN